MGINLYKVEVLESGAKKPSFVYIKADDFSKVEERVLKIKMSGATKLLKYSEVLSIVKLTKKDQFIN
jgi:hypothetical protein